MMYNSTDMMYNSYPGMMLILLKHRNEHRHDVIYLGTCPETTCNDNYIGEAKRQIFERVKDYNGRDFKSHLLKHALKTIINMFQRKISK